MRAPRKRALLDRMPIDPNINSRRIITVLFAIVFAKIRDRGSPSRRQKRHELSRKLQQI